ncbi:hypothetical protein J3R82DRAFT_7559, partial [Butyriboletus roseoflavus]
PLPWHRVISPSGSYPAAVISPAYKEALEVEGVPIFTGSYGESRVVFDQPGWFP